MSSPLQPRDAFFGGRTNAVRLHHHVARPQETIRSQDVTSLYPWVNRYALYPVGHPIILTDIQHVDISQYFGLCKVTVIPPRGLFHPVLPYRYGGKLVFQLSKTCMETEMDKPLWERRATCPHDDAQRAMTGTWCTPEVVEAVEQGYRIERIHEVWQFPPNQRKIKVFSSYVDTWLRLKTESNGYPRWANTDEDFQTATYLPIKQETLFDESNRMSFSKEPQISLEDLIDSVDFQTAAYPPIKQETLFDESNGMSFIEEPQTSLQDLIDSVDFQTAAYPLTGRPLTRMDYKTQLSLLTAPEDLRNVDNRWDMLPLELKTMIVDMIVKPEEEEAKAYWKVRFQRVVGHVIYSMHCRHCGLTNIPTVTPYRLASTKFICPSAYRQHLGFARDEFNSFLAWYWKGQPDDLMKMV